MEAQLGPTWREAIGCLFVFSIPALFFLGLIVDRGGEWLWLLAAVLAIAAMIVIAIHTYRNRNRSMF